MSIHNGRAHRRAHQRPQRGWLRATGGRTSTGRTWSRIRLGAALVAIVTIVLPTSLGPATAGPGSVISGVVWSDLDLDNVKDTGENNLAGVTVRLLNSVTGTQVATTTTGAGGAYSFASVADGSFRAEVVAPTNFAAAPSIAGSNDFASTGNPAPGQPWRAQTAPIVIAGATQSTNVDAALRPIPQIQLEPVPIAGGCQSLATTGVAPFDATDGGGKDSSASNCLVRTNDTVTMSYSVSVTNLPSGSSVNNVVAEFTIKSADGGRATFNGPSAGMPNGCLTTGVTPVSAIIANADGNHTLRCNLGTFTTSVKPVTVTFLSQETSPPGSSIRLDARSYAGGQDALPTATLAGPDIATTGIPLWDLRVSAYAAPAAVQIVTIDGQPRRGYTSSYRIDFAKGQAKGVTALTGPLTFTQKFVDWPTARLIGCAKGDGNIFGGYGPAHAGTINCGPGQAEQGTDGYQVTLSGFDSARNDVDSYLVTMFIPEEDAYRRINPSWTTGDPVPSGTVARSFELSATNGWKDMVNALNYGTGFEPGWDGTTSTGNNRAVNAPLTIQPPSAVITASKRYFSPLGGCCAAGPLQPDKRVGTAISLATDANTTVTNPVLCDVFDVTTMRLDTPLSTAPAGYRYEYAEGPAGTDAMSGPRLANGTFPYDSTPLREAVTGCRTYAGPWSTNPSAAFGADWQDTVNMFRLVPITTDPATVLGPVSTLQAQQILRARSTFNGGPHAGEKILSGVMMINQGGWSDPMASAAARGGWTTQQVLENYVRDSLVVSTGPQQASYLPGETVRWTINAAIDGGAGDLVHNVTVTDTLSAELEYDRVATEAALPAGVTASYNPATRQVTLSYGDHLLAVDGRTTLPTAYVFTRIAATTAPGVRPSTTVRISSPDVAGTPTTSSSVLVTGTGELAVVKSVDRTLIRPGDSYTWRLDWANTTELDFGAPDVIDVLPWNGDGATGSLSRREQYSSDYHGSNVLTGALAQPTYTAGATGDVPGTWYYATAVPGTISHDPRHASNASPAAAGGTWRTAAEIQAGAGFGAVTAVRFVSAGQVLRKTAVRAVIPQVATSSVLNDTLVNRAALFSSSFPNQLLLSSEPFVLVPGFSLGDRVWNDADGNGVHNTGEAGFAGVVVEALNAAGTVVGTTTTNASGRWVVEGLPPGTYRARIPASQFQAGGPLAGFQVRTASSNLGPADDEGLDNNNTATADPAAAGLTSPPVTFAHTVDGSGNITGGGQPTGDNPARLGEPLIPDDYTNLTVDFALAATPEITVVKRADQTQVRRAGDVIHYELVVTNTGDLALTDVRVTDQLAAPAGPALALDCPQTTLAVDATMTCVADYTVTQADIDHGQVRNTATATGTPPFGADVTDTDAVTVPAATEPRLSVVKTGDTDVAHRAGDVVRYSFVVTNTGNQTLTGVTVVDLFAAPAGPGGPTTVECPATTLVPAQSMTCTPIAYTVSQADVNEGAVDNTATATGTTPAGSPVTSPDSTWHVEIPTDASVTVATSSDVSQVFTAGDVVNYSFVVTNTGNVPLTGVELTGQLAAPAGPAVTIDCPQDTLAPDEQMRCTASPYTATQADIDAGGIDSTTHVSGQAPSGAVVTGTDSLSVSAPSRPALTLVKGSDVGTIHNVGDQVTYSFQVSNSGNVTLADIEVIDVFAAPAGPAVSVDCPQASLAPLESMTCHSSPYDATQADVDNGGITNTATVSGTPPTGDAVTDQDGLTVPVPSAPGITVEKSSDVSRYYRRGDEVSFFFLVTNTGNVTLTGVSVTDRLDFPAGPEIGVECPRTTLLAGESMTCTSVDPYVVTQEDMDNGHLSDTATASGTPPTGSPVTGTDSLDVAAEVAPAIDLVKSADVSVVRMPGDQIRYGFLVRNTGNMTLTGFELADDFAAPAGPDQNVDCPYFSLQPQEEMVCELTYTVTQADIDHGGVDNLATVTSNDAQGNRPTSESGVHVDAPAAPSLQLVKSADVVTAQQAGDRIGYSFAVKNAGNVTLTDLAVDDVLLAPAGPALDIVCPETSLGAGAEMVCTADPYTVTQADVDNGAVDNRASVSGTDPAGLPVSSADSRWHVGIAEAPGLEVVKRADVTEVHEVGDRISYAFDVSNTGNVTVHDLTLDDQLVAPAGPEIGVDCPRTTLAPAEQVTCTATYPVTQADIDHGSVANGVTASAVSPAGTEVSDSDAATVAAPAAPAVGLVKTATESSVDRAGATIHYEFAVTNLGNVTLHDVEVVDVLTAPAGPEIGVDCPRHTLGGGETMTCTASYVVTQADVDHGTVDNVATVTGTPPAGDAVTDTDDLSVPVPAGPAIKLVKKADRASVSAAGDVIRYRFVVTNTGNVTLSQVTLTDDLVAPAGPEIDVSCPSTTLRSGRSMTCTGSPYTVTAADLEAGQVENSANVTGESPGTSARRAARGGVTADADTLSIPVRVTAAPRISLDKWMAKVVDGNGNDVVDAGDGLVYGFTVTNTGEVEVERVRVVDPMLAGRDIGVDCPDEVLEPAEKVTCTAERAYTITSADVDRGRIVNRASARARTVSTGAAVTVSSGEASLSTPVRVSPGSIDTGLGADHRPGPDRLGLTVAAGLLTGGLGWLLLLALRRRRRTDG